MNDKIHFCCPYCKSDLGNDGESLHCVSCAKNFPIVNGIPFFHKGRTFYESRWIKPHMISGGRLSYMRLRLDPKASFFLRNLPASGTLLDLGCGGGFDLFTNGRTVAGIDISVASLREASSIYDLVAMADSARIPFPDVSFDVIVSWDFFGHVAFSDKNKVISEIWRLLKNKGKTIHYIETQGDNPFEASGKRNPNLYRKHFIEKDGHVGLEVPSATLKRFRDQGFKLKALRKCSFTALRYPEEVIKRFDNEYRSHFSDIDFYVRVCRMIEKSRSLNAVSKLMVVAAEAVLSPLTPIDCASGVCVCFEKV